MKSAPAPTSTDVVFNISDAREEQQFDVKVRFDQGPISGTEKRHERQVDHLY